MITVNQQVAVRHPGASVGAVALENIQGPGDDQALREAAGRINEELQARYGQLDRAGIKKSSPAAVYADYYRQFGQSYHLLGQLDSVLSGQKPLTPGLSLPSAMFMAEIESLLLTAGHDLDRLELPLELVVTGEGQEYTGLSGRQNKAAAGDLGLADRRGLISTIVKGPDQRSRLTPETRRAVFTVYGPPGLPAELLNRHLDRLAEYVTLTAAGATVSWRGIYPAS